MDFLLEVIACSVGDAMEAEAGGANRIELCVALESGGLTPPIGMVREVLQNVSIPVRVMVCENPTYERPQRDELERLLQTVGELGSLDVAGLVIGFSHGRVIDLDTLRDLCAAAPQLRVTFHRVFERLADPLTAISELKTLPQVDRILLSTGDWDALARAANPNITLIAGGGLRSADFQKLLKTTLVREFHAGRAVREQEKADGRVDARLVRSLMREIVT